MVFPHFGSKGTKGLFSSGIGSWVIFRNKFQQSHARLVERKRRVDLPWLLEQDLVAPSLRCWWSPRGSGGEVGAPGLD